MAIGDPYATLAELKSRLGIGDTSDDTRLTSALNTASRGIEKECRRQFNDAGTASARMFYPRSGCLTKVDDFHTTVSAATGLIVATDQGDDGTYETTWSDTDFFLEPLGGVSDGESGWPYWRIRAVNKYFPVCTRRPSLQLTARWGWAAVPDPIKEACLVLASEIFKLKDAPFGVAGYGDYGPVRVRQNPIACQMIAPYKRDPVLV